MELVRLLHRRGSDCVKVLESVTSVEVTSYLLIYKKTCEVLSVGKLLVTCKCN